MKQSINSLNSADVMKTRFKDLSLLPEVKLVKGRQSDGSGEADLGVARNSASPVSWIIFLRLTQEGDEAIVGLLIATPSCMDCTSCRTGVRSAMMRLGPKKLRRRRTLLVIQTPRHSDSETTQPREHRFSLFKLASCSFLIARGSN